MKKLLVLLMVLGFTTSASAVVDLNLSVTLDPYGDPQYIEDPADSQISIVPSEEIWIDVHGTVPSGEYLNTWIIAQGPATMSGGVVLQGDGGVTEYDPSAELSPGYTWENFFADQGYSGVSPMIEFVGFVDSTEPFSDLTGILLDEKLLHCEDLGDVTISILNADTGEYEVYDQLVIHQIPEPMTVALLGLGGLFLIRRRRA